MSTPSAAELEVINSRRAVRGYIRQILCLILGEVYVNEKGIEESCRTAIEKLSSSSSPKSPTQQ